MSRPDFDDGIITQDQKKLESKLTEPPKYRVILHNDDYTPMDFVTMILQKIFNYSYQQAEVLMIKVHFAGKGTVGVYPYEIAEMKIMKATNLAQEQGYPLMLSLEKESAQ